MLCIWCQPHEVLGPSSWLLAAGVAGQTPQLWQLFVKAVPAAFCSGHSASSKQPESFFLPMLTTIEQKVQCPNTDEAPLFQACVGRAGSTGDRSPWLISLSQSGHQGWEAKLLNVVCAGLFSAKINQVCSSSYMVQRRNP